MKWRKLFGFLSVMGVLIVLGGAAYRATLPDNPFSNKYRVLTSVPWVSQTEEESGIPEEKYAWLDNETIVYFVRDKQGKSHAVKQRIGKTQTFPAEPFAAIKTSLMIREFSIAPSGKALSLMGKDAKGNEYFQMFALDGSGQSQQFPPTDHYVYWIDDGRSVIWYAPEFSKLVRYSLERSLPPLPKLSPKYPEHLLFAPDGTYFASEFHVDPYLSLRLEQGSISSSQVQVRDLPVGRDTYICAVADVSPQGKRLLWYSAYTQISWFASLQAKLTQQPADSQTKEHWYVTGTDGNNLHTVAAIEANILPKWLPDGKHVSIVYKGALYVIPVP